MVCQRFESANGWISPALSFHLENPPFMKKYWTHHSAKTRK